MKNRHKDTKEKTLVFRVPKAAVKSLDILAKLLGIKRSEVLRRLIPDLSKTKAHQQKGVER